MKILSALLDKLVKWAEKYEAYVERENAALRAQIKDAQYRNIVDVTRGEYNGLSEYLFDAIHNTEAITCLCMPKTIRSLRCTPRVAAFADGYWAFRFRCYRYDRKSVTADDVERILQQEMDQLCDDANKPGVAVRVSFDGDNGVSIFMMRRAMFQQRRMDQIRKTVMENGQKNAE